MSVTIDLNHAEPQPLATAHASAVELWKKYFKKTGDQPKPSLLSVLAEQLRRIEAKCGRSQWANYLAAAGLISEKDQFVMSSMLDTDGAERVLHALPHQRNMVLFVQAICALQWHQEADLKCLHALRRSGYSPGSGVDFVKRIWDGYFALACAAAKTMSHSNNPDVWPLDVPGLKLQDMWHMLAREQLRNSAAPIWVECANSGSMVVQTRFVCNEYQMPALWQSVDRMKDGPKRAFSAVRKNVKAKLHGDDLGWSDLLKTLAFEEPLAQPNARPDERTAKFFGLPGLLWAMGVDGGLRRSGQFAILQNNLSNQASSFLMNTPQKPAPTRDQVMQEVQRAKNSKRPPQRFAATPTNISDTAMTSTLTLNPQTSTAAWQDADEVWTWRLLDAPALRAKHWQAGVFWNETGGKNLPVVLGIEGPHGQVLEWLWGTCEDWGLANEVGDEAEFVVWPSVPDDHALRSENLTPLITQSSVLDMANFGGFTGLYVMYLQVSLLR